EEINLPFTLDDPMPPVIKEEDYDSGRDISILEELLDNYSLSLSDNESYHFDIPSPYRPPTKPPDGKTGTLNIKMMGDVSDQKVKLNDLKQALRGRHPMLIIVQYSRKYEDYRQKDFVLKSSFPLHKLGITLSIRKGAHTGYNCLPKVPIISNPEPCNQTMNNELPQTLPSFGSVPCVSKPNFVDESSNIFNPPPQPPIYSCEFYGSNAQYGHYCTPQAPFNNPEPGYSQDLNFPQNIHNFQQRHPIFNAHNDFLNSQNELSTSQNTIMEQMTQLTSMCEMVCQIVQKKQEEKRIEEEQAANARYWKILACCDDDDDYDSAITPVLSTEEPVNSLSMGDKHLDIIPATELDKVIKSSVEDLVPIPNFESVDDQSLHNEDVSKKIFSNPLFEEEIISIKKNQHHFNAESDLVESMLNRDSSIISSSSKIDYLLDEFAEFNSENSNAEIESFSPSPIPNEDNDSFMEEIDLFLTPDDPMPPSIEDDDNDSEGDNLFLERLLHDDPIPLLDTLDFSNVVRVFLPSLTQASPLIIFIRLSLVYLIGVELSRNSILTVVT
nr:hypothetical protein [Tanacetum cinerariifolium]